MRIWITELAEPLPIDPGTRLWRVGLLAQTLAREGHEVTWWTSEFDHFTRRHRGARETAILVPNYQIRLLPGPGYGRNVSLSRVRHHRAIARAFSDRAPGEPRPDVIHCCLPTLEVTEAAVRYAVARGVPAVVDIRDLWPDSIPGLFPGIVRPLIRLALAREFARARYIFRRASAIVAVSDAYLQWGLGYARRPAGPRDGVFPHGYPEAEATAAERADAREALRAAGVDPERTICCFVGTFGRTYDLGPAIDAARALPEVQFVMAGGGDLDAQWRDRAAGLPNVVFPGWLTAAGVAVLLEMSDVALAAYAAGAPQGLPNKIFEYLSAGLPVVSSLRGETEKLLRETGSGLTYDPRVPRDFETVLNLLLQSPVRRDEAGRKARAAYERAFSAERVYPALARRLVEIAARREPAPASGGRR